MERMGTRSATELLQLPIRLHGIRLGRPVDLLFDSAEWRALGFVVLCGDESLRFFVFAAGDVRDDAIEVPSAFLLLENLDFYRDRCRSLRALLGHPVANGASELGELRDVLLRADGTVESLVVHSEDDARKVGPPSGTPGAEHVSTA